MFTPKNAHNTHKHDLYRVARPHLRGGEKRWLIVWKCKTCPWEEGADLLKEKPGGTHD